MPKSIGCTDSNLAITFGSGMHKLQLCTGGRAQKHNEVKIWL